jgi:hypothetical protein
MTLEQYITIQLNRVRRFEYAALKQQNQGALPKEGDELTWEEQFAMFMAEDFAQESAESSSGQEVS